MVAKRFVCGAVVAAAIAIAVVLEYLFDDSRTVLYDSLFELADGNTLLEGVFTALTWTLPEVSIALVLYELGRARFASRIPPPSASETRCRYCGEVMFALDEPRCPACGERI